MRIPRIMAVLIGLFCLVPRVAMAEPAGIAEPANAPPPVKWVVPSYDPEANYLSAVDFRKRFPAPTDLSKALDAYANADKFLRMHARNGASAYVTLVSPDGSMTYGHDTYFSGTPNRLHEIRENYEAIAVNPLACFTKKPVTKWSCNDLEYDVGLRKIDPDAIVSVKHDKVTCETRVCDKYVFVEAETGMAGGERVVAAAPDRNHYVLCLLLRQDGTPVMSSESLISEGSVSGTPASFVYDFPTPVNTFELPVHH